MPVPTYKVYSQGKFCLAGASYEAATAWVAQYMREKLRDTEEVKHVGVVSTCDVMKHGALIIYYYQREERHEGYADWRTFPRRQNVFSIFEE